MFPDLGVKRLAERLRQLEAGAVEALHTVLQLAGSTLADKSVRVCVLSLELGERLGLPAAEIRDLEFSALLHNIGFLGLPTEILRKHGLLTAEERQLLRRHPQLGKAVLGEIPGFERVGHIVGGHHERPDGLGYPAALRGPQIPMPSRILYVAETFQAMMTDRNYRTRMPLGEAIERLRAGAGSRYDETVVDQLGRDADGLARLLADCQLRRSAADLCQLASPPEGVS